MHLNVANYWKRNNCRTMTWLHQLLIEMWALGMCISITEVNTICISMHSQWYDTFNLHMKKLLMRCDTIYPYYVAVGSDFDSIQHNAIQCNTMQWGKIWCYAIQYGTDSLLLFLCFIVIIWWKMQLYLCHVNLFSMWLSGHASVSVVFWYVIFM